MGLLRELSEAARHAGAISTAPPKKLALGESRRMFLLQTTIFPCLLKEAGHPVGRVSDRGTPRSPDRPAYSLTPPIPMRAAVPYLAGTPVNPASLSTSRRNIRSRACAIEAGPPRSRDIKLMKEDPAGWRK